MHVLYLDPMTKDALAYAQQFAGDASLAAPERDDAAEREALAPAADVLITKRTYVDGALMDKVGDRLRLIQLQSGRRDRVDLEAARARGVSVALAPQVGCIAVAEFAMLLMLGVSKKIAHADRLTRAGAYRELGLTPEPTHERKHAFQWMKLPDLFELHGRTLGLVGFGEIATEVARRSKAFGMRVLYTKRERVPEEIEREEAVAYRDLPDLLAESDLVSLHVPHSDATDKMIDAAALGRMKSSAYLINTCRGGVVDEDALVAALRDGTIAGAGLDVFVEEPVPHDHPLLALDNVLLAPHLGGGSGGARMKQTRDTLANVVALQRGEALQYRID